MYGIFPKFVLAHAGPTNVLTSIDLLPFSTLVQQ